MKSKFPAVEAAAARSFAIASPEFVLTERFHGGEAVALAFGRLAEQLGARQAELLSLMVYASPHVRPQIETAMREVLGGVQWPVTWIESSGFAGGTFGGLQAFAISGVPVTRLRVGRRVVGSVFEDGFARHCLLGGIGPTSNAMRPAAQVQQAFGNLEWALDQAGFELGDVVRTWFYNDEIVSWYDDFNRVRSAQYANVKWRTGSIPASTGIGASNPAEAAVTVAAWAVQPLDGGSCAREIASPLQCPAPAYGSSFARAMELQSGAWRRLLISGTASIHPDGKTAWVGNAKKQVDLTMEVIAAILHSRGMAFTDVTRATAYFEHPLFKPYFDAWCAARGLKDMPVVSAHCDICRADLLFELELDACTAGPAPQPVAAIAAQDSATGA
jgi:enamine deaminase RidA (YjgF/YER057c/UK114 family)